MALCTKIIEKVMLRNIFQPRSFNPLRIVQLLLCACCLAISISILVFIQVSLNTLLTAILMTFGGALTLITLVDVIITTLLKPLAWTAWIVFATSGAVGFFLCSGIFLLFKRLPMVLYILSILINSITGLLFLLEVISILVWLWQTQPKPFIQRKPKKKLTGKASSGPVNTFQFTERPLQCHCKQVDRNEKLSNSPEGSLTKAASGVKITSHGGTFHVSKDVAPLTSSPAVSNASGSPKRMSKQDLQATSSGQRQQTDHNISSGHYYIFPCEQCGGSHQHSTATIPSTDGKASNYARSEGTDPDPVICYPCPYLKSYYPGGNPDQKDFSTATNFGPIQNDASPRGVMPSKFANKNVCCDCFLYEKGDVGNPCRISLDSTKRDVSSMVYTNPDTILPGAVDNRSPRMGRTGRNITIDQQCPKVCPPVINRKHENITKEQPRKKSAKR